jgi:hypothetical protein
MRQFRHACAALCAVALSPLAAQAAVVQPEAGYYHALTYMAAASPECAAIGEKTGNSNEGVFYYPGAGKLGAEMRISEPKDLKIGVETFPRTPAAGVAIWKGKSKIGYEPPGLSATLDFRAKIAYLSKRSFSAVITTDIVLSPSATCTTTENIAFIKTGS